MCNVQTLIGSLSFAGDDLYKVLSGQPGKLDTGEILSLDFHRGSSVPVSADILSTGGPTIVPASSMHPAFGPLISSDPLDIRERIW